MTGPQLRKFLESSDLSIRKAAEALGMQERQFYRYLTGEAEIPLVVEYALKWVLQQRKK